MMKNKYIGLLLMRLLLGSIFFFQGYGKVVTIGVEDLFGNMFLAKCEGVFSEGLMWFTAYFTSYVELIGGALLILGLLRDWALYALALALFIVSIGHGYAEIIWDLSHVLFRAVLLIPLLLLPSDWDRFRLDTLVFPKK